MLTSRQLAEWMAYYAIEPFGERAEWLRTGVLASVIANVHRGSKATKPFSPEDFMPKYDDPQPDRQQTIEEQRAALVQIFDYAKKHGLTKKD